MKTDDIIESRILQLLRAFSVLMFMVLTSVTVIYFNETRQMQAWPDGIVFTLTLVVAINLACVWSYYSTYREYQRQVNYALWTMIACTTLMHFTAASLETAGAFAAFSISRVSQSYGLRTGIYFIAGAVFLFTTAMIVRNFNYEHLFFPLIAIPVYFFVLTLSYTFVREQKLRIQTHQLMKELESVQSQLAQSSKENERLRIAREMHDLLGHHMTALILNLEIAKHKIKGNGVEETEQSLALGKLLLSDLRAAVNDLRTSTAVDFKETLRQVIETIPEITIALHMDETLNINDSLLADTLLRCIQESLTNTLKHSQATQSNITIHQVGNDVIFSYEDNGFLQGEVVPGNGLKGMLERVTTLSGKLKWAAKNGSLRIQASLPAGTVSP